MLSLADRQERIERLIDLYESELARGRRLTPDEVCGNDPDLIDEVAQQIQILESVGRYLGSLGGHSSTGLTVRVRGLLPGYEFGGRIGGGGFGIVYRGKQLSLRRQVAIKIIITGDQRHVEREARILAAIQSPYVVTIFEYVKLSESLSALVMELVEGGDLAAKMKLGGGKTPEGATLGWMRDVASGMDTVAKEGIVHRDLKPGNILIGRDHRAKVGDFGIARGTRGFSTMTRSGAFMGTPLYMSPEQAKDPHNVDTRSDIYSFGATFYHALTGYPLFDADSLVELLFKHIAEPAVPASKRNPELSEAVCQVLDRCVAKLPEKRYQSFQEVLDALLPVTEAIPRANRKPPKPVAPPPPQPLGKPLWVYKCHHAADAQGDWTYFFEQAGGKGRWGGTWCINNASSRKILREHMRVGDLVLAWQTDDKAAIGLCRVTKLERDGDEVGIFLEAIRRFQPPVKLLKFKSKSPALANGKAFVQGKLGTLFETTEAEAAEILRICDEAPIAVGSVSGSVSSIDVGGLDASFPAINVGAGFEVPTTSHASGVGADESRYDRR